MKILVFILFSVVLFSCVEEERTELNSFEKDLVDSLYQERISYLRKELDSTCTANEQRYFENYVDSLKAAYLEDIEHIENYLKSGNEK